jgi:hypothetical protein
MRIGKFMNILISSIALIHVNAMKNEKNPAVKKPYFFLSPKKGISIQRINSTIPLIFQASNIG